VGATGSRFSSLYKDAFPAPSIPFAVREEASSVRLRTASFRNRTADLSD
jgi:hypothetical protein